MNTFLLILGPSGAGKSTIIKRLLVEDSNLIYVTPYTDRPSRPSENFKISITKEEFTKMEKAGKFAAVNHYFTYRYGTPKETIDEALKNGKVPILDMMLSGVKKFEMYKDILYCIYIKPPSLESLRERLSKDKRDVTGQRFKEGQEELMMLETTHFQHQDIDAVVENVNLEKSIAQVQRIIASRVS